MDKSFCSITDQSSVSRRFSEPLLTAVMVACEAGFFLR